MSGKKRRVVGLSSGLCVALGFATLVFLAKQVPGSPVQLYLTRGVFRITARFDEVADLRAGALVTIAGVRIGRVTRIALDPTEFKAIVTMRIDQRYNEIPDDSSASIESAGLLGGEYVALQPGASSRRLRADSRIENSRSALVLEKVIDEFFANWAKRG